MSCRPDNRRRSCARRLATCVAGLLCAASGQVFELPDGTVSNSLAVDEFGVHIAGADFNGVDTATYFFVEHGTGVFSQTPLAPLTYAPSGIAQAISPDGTRIGGATTDYADSWATVWDPAFPGNPTHYEPISAGPGNTRIVGLSHSLAVGVLNTGVPAVWSSPTSPVELPTDLGQGSATGIAASDSYISGFITVDGGFQRAVVWENDGGGNFSSQLLEDPLGWFSGAADVADDGSGGFYAVGNISDPMGLHPGYWDNGELTVIDVADGQFNAVAEDGFAVGGGFVSGPYTAIVYRPDLGLMTLTDYLAQFSITLPPTSTPTNIYDVMLYDGHYYMAIEASGSPGNLIVKVPAVPLPIPGDIDGDGDVDIDDFAIFADCLAGPGGSIPPGCDPDDFAASDLDGDDDADLADFAHFQVNFGS